MMVLMAKPKPKDKPDEEPPKKRSRAQFKIDTQETD